MIGCSWGSASDVGLVRRLNEDSLLASPPVFLVADGMGGHAAGDVASTITVAAFSRYVARSGVSQSEIALALDAANTAILEFAERAEGQRGMGTTVAGIGMGGPPHTPRWVVFGVGDSRVYALRDGELTQLTHDHSAVQELVDAGELTPEQARAHPRRNVVTRALGSPETPVPDFVHIAPRVGDRYVICSDGLSGEMDDQEIARVLGEATSPQAAADDLVARALHHGGRDNVTVIVLEPAQDDDDSDDVLMDDTTPPTSRVATAPETDADSTARSGLVAGLPEALRVESPDPAAEAKGVAEAPRPGAQPLISMVPGEHELTGRYSHETTGDPLSGGAGKNGDEPGGAT